MDFRSKLLQPLPDNRVRGLGRPLPFYMSYPGYFETDTEASWLRDMEYLQQMYPAYVKHCQRRIGEILDRADYEGSMIYDEYPDKYSIITLTESIKKVMEMEEEQAPDENIVQVLLLNEICKRRHGAKDTNLYFTF